MGCALAEAVSHPLAGLAVLARDREVQRGLARQVLPARLPHAEATAEQRRHQPLGTRGGGAEEQIVACAGLGARVRVGDKVRARVAVGRAGGCLRACAR